MNSTCCCNGSTRRAATNARFLFLPTRSPRKRDEGSGWLGIKFQVHPHGDPSTIIIHVRTLDKESLRQQEALGIIGVNLIHGAFYKSADPADLIGSLLDDLSSAARGSGHDQIFRPGVHRRGQPAHGAPACRAMAHRGRDVHRRRRNHHPRRTALEKTRAARTRQFSSAHEPDARHARTRAGTVRAGQVAARRSAGRHV